MMYTYNMNDNVEDFPRNPTKAEVFGILYGAGPEALKKIRENNMPKHNPQHAVISCKPRIKCGEFRCGLTGDGLKVEVLESCHEESLNDHRIYVRLGVEENSSLCITKDTARILADFFTTLEEAL